MKNKNFEMIYADNSRKILEIYKIKKKKEKDVLSKKVKMGDYKKELRSKMEEK